MNGHFWTQNSVFVEQRRTPRDTDNPTSSYGRTYEYTAMFRNPRENSTESHKILLKPSTGRPPTPPNSSRAPHHPPTTMASRSSSNPLAPRSNTQLKMASSNKQTMKKVTPAKTPGKPNSSILTFFKKVDSPLKDDSIFLSQGSNANEIPSRPRLATPDLDIDSDSLYGDSSAFGRFNEVEGSVKRRKTSNSSIQSSSRDKAKRDGDIYASGSTTSEHAYTPPPDKSTKPKPKKSRRTGPFLSDSESENDLDNHALHRAAMKGEKKELDDKISDRGDDMNDMVETNPINQKQIHKNLQLDFVEPINDGISKRCKRVPVSEAQAKWEALQPKSLSSIELDMEVRHGKTNPKSRDSLSESTSRGRDLPVVPNLKEEASSIDEWGKFDDIDEYPDDDEFADGEEFIERKWMEEQAKLEAAEEGDDGKTFDVFPDDDTGQKTPDEGMTPSCPICDASLGGIGPDEATRHVNGCLDGNPIPLPKPVKREPTEVKLMPTEASNRFSRKAAIPRPGQANPFEIGGGEGTTSNYFSKLMSGKAEDAAWASAAAAEQSSRGRPAYQRTCPFYKIMPGFFICVDAFRYGAVQGCNAYFLSHFHSDHYIGLTSSWCHGPIYCSKVTANLVKQQLRVDPKWVVALDFEERFEVPQTHGVAITMIPANHCPGSSLFLFEKVVGRGANPKIQRVLHCGDFRACPAHIDHPLLMPDIVDSITGKTKQQKIDVCYLDTTYLNPRYAFPSQEDVIKACADMCVSLRKERAEENDAWETVKRERAGTGMAKFIKNAPIKSEDDSIAMAINSDKPRGRLLVICGTYSIGKERICMGIARALDCKIWAPPGKMRICAALEDPELMSRMTDDPREAQIHMQMLMEIRAETLQEYLNGFKPHFSRIVGFRPSGWNYRPPNSRFTDSPSIPTVLHSENWQSRYSMSELIPQRGSTREASCFGVPYSEHSSFRELTMFVCALRIDKVVPTVNVGSAAGRAKMKAWIERWLAERRKNGCVKIGEGVNEGSVRW